MSDHNEQMEKFRAAAKKFIEDVDAASQTETNTFLANVGRSIAELYSVALSLPAVEPETTGADEAPFQKDKSTSYVAPSNEKLVPSTPIGKSSIPLRKKNQRKEVCQETSPKFILTSSRALNWTKLVLQSLTSFSIGGWIFSTIGADTY